MSDAIGLIQFLSAIGEMSRGWLAPSIPPVWERHLLMARDPPRVTCKHREYDEVEEETNVYKDNMVQRSFFFGSTQVSALRKHVPQHLQKCSNFELLAACLWRCRTIALQANPEEEVRFTYAVNARSKFNPPMPIGYYGNATASPRVATQAKKLCEYPLEYAIELVKQAKSDVTEEYMKSLLDTVIKDQALTTLARTYAISDLTRVGFRDVDFGWGKAVYGGPANVDIGFVSFLIPFKNNEGEDGLLVPITLPNQAMEIFMKELDVMLNVKKMDGNGRKKSVLVSSSM